MKLPQFLWISETKIEKLYWNISLEHKILLYLDIVSTTSIAFVFWFSLVDTTITLKLNSTLNLNMQDVMQVS